MALLSGEGGSVPLVGNSISRAMRRRLLEVAGLGYAALGVLLGLALASYAVTDPSYFNATPKPPENWLGRVGAFIADPMMRAFGIGAWSFVALLVVWGARFVFHRHEKLIWRRLPAIPVAVLLGTVFTSTHVPWQSWPLPAGLGGWLGDSGVALLMKITPLAPDLALRSLSIGLFAALLVSATLALGATASEIAWIAEWLWQSAREALGAAWRFSRVLLRGMVGMIHSAISRARGENRPRSERLDPAEPTGSWRNRVPGLARAAQVGDRVAELAAKVPPGLPADLRGAFEDQKPDLKALGIDPELDPDAAISMTSGRIEPTLGGDNGPKSGIAGAPYTGVENALSAAMRALSGDHEDKDGGEHELPLDLAEESQHGAGNASAPRPPVSRGKTDKRISRRARRERQPGLFEPSGEDAYMHPPLSLLQKPARVERNQMSDIALEENARMLETVLEDYGVRGEIVAVKPGPVVTLYELEPAPGLKASRVIGLADDIARSMSALSARVSTMPGRSVIGIELPNATRETVYLRETLESPHYGDSQYRLALALGKDIQGRQIVANLAKMPHLLIAGTTGSGKSVAINTMILSLLYRLSPRECRLIMIDPKMLELSVYDNIPHLLAPVVTDPKKALVALKWVVAEMEERYRKMSKMGVRNIDGHNARVREALKKGEEFSRVVQTGFDEATGEPIYETETFEPEEMPFIVVIVDEMADLMMVAGKEIEACIQRLAQMARASGIHLIMATQRPSVDVITGTIKANFPTRISFQVTSKIDSRTILGEQGAEQLLGQGDMLYMAGGGRITRVHGPFVTDEEVEEVVRHLKAMGVPDYVSAVTEGGDEQTQALVDEKLGLAQPGDSDDDLYDRAVAIVARDRRCSTSYIQRKLQIGYNRAARLVEQMEEQGVVSSANAVGKREILIEER